VDFGAELRRRRIAAGLSLAGLAALAHYSRGHLSKVETGHTVASTELARQCDRVLRADGALVAMAMALSGHKLERSGRDSDHEPASAVDVASRYVPANGTRSPSWGIQALPAGLVHLAPVTAEQAESTLAVFSVFFDQLRGLGQRFYSGALLRTLIAQAETLQSLAMSAGNRERALLLELAARYAVYAGWMAQEAGDDDAAIYWTGEAVRLAHAAGQPEMAAYALVRRALISMYRGDAAQTVGFAQQAQSDKHASHRVQGLAALHEAQGHALTASRTACLRSLDHARDLLDKEAAGDRSPMYGSSTVTDPVTMVTGWCMHDLGRSADAAAVLEGELARLPLDAHRARTRYGIRCALAYAASGEIERACELTKALLGNAQELSSATIRTDLARLARALNRWAGHLPVRELQPELASALWPVPHRLPCRNPMRLIVPTYQRRRAPLTLPGWDRR
jgi:Helix-turn-helix domain